MSEIGQRRGTGETLDLFAPGVRSPSLRQLGAAIERASASPAMFQALVARLALTNVRPLLPRITAPTLVLHREREYIPVDEARTLAAGIRGARLVELEGADHHPWAGDWRRVIDEIGTFLDAVLPPAVRQVSRPPRRSGRAAESARPAHGWPSLTPAEQAVVELVAEGLSNRAIADRLVVSRYTVETHLKHVFAKLGVVSRAGQRRQHARRGLPAESGPIRRQRWFRVADLAESAGELRWIIRQLCEAVVEGTEIPRRRFAQLLTPCQRELSLTLTARASTESLRVALEVAFTVRAPASSAQSTSDHRT